MTSRNKREGVFLGRCFRMHLRSDIDSRCVKILWSYMNQPDNRKRRKELHISTKSFYSKYDPDRKPSANRKLDIK